jgi:hypothetical protein
LSLNTAPRAPSLSESPASVRGPGLPATGWAPAVGGCCSDSAARGERNLRQRDCHLASVSSPTVRQPLNSSYRCEAREEAGSAAFRWTHASWGNASRGLPCDSMAGGQGRDCRRPLAAQVSATSALLRTAIRAQPQRNVSRLNNLSFRARHTSMAVFFRLR